MEIDDKMACIIHGIISSDSDSDSCSKSELDEEYHSLKPPPLDYKSIKDKIVISSPKQTESDDDFTVVTSKRRRKTKVKSMDESMEEKTKPEFAEMENIQTEVSLSELVFLQPDQVSELLDETTILIEDDIVVQDEAEMVCDTVAVAKKKKKKSKSKRKAENSAKNPNPKPSNQSNQQKIEEQKCTCLSCGCLYRQQNKAEAFLANPQTCIDNLNDRLQREHPNIQEESFKKLIYMAEIINEGVQKINEILDLSRHESESNKLRQSENECLPLPPKKNKKKASKQSQTNPTPTRVVIERQLNLKQLNEEISNRAWTLPEDFQASNEPVVKTKKNSEENEKQITDYDSTNIELLEEQTSSIRNNNVGMDQTVALRPASAGTSPRILFSVNRRNFNILRINLERIERSRGFSGRSNSIQDFARIFNRLLRCAYTEFRNSESASNDSVSNINNAGILCCIENSNNDSSALRNETKENQRFLVRLNLTEVAFIVLMTKLVETLLKEIVAFLYRNTICICLILSAFLTINTFKSRKT